MKKFQELNKFNSTIVVVDGVEYRTTQDPYINDEGDAYKAHALDAEGNEYLITWVAVNTETEDESDTCDWDNPINIKTI